MSYYGVVRWNGSRLICRLKFTMSCYGVVRWNGSRLIWIVKFTMSYKTTYCGVVKWFYSFLKR